MRVLTVFAHPDRHSFCGAVLDRFQDGLRKAGHDVDVADLYAERFDPVFGPYDSAFIAPVYWLGFPAILKGWVERVFTHGFACRLTPEGWEGDVRGRIPLLHHSKALLISTTFFGQAVYDQGLKDAMECLIDSWGFRYPGIRSVEHKYFWAVPSVGPERRLQYLDEAYELGRGYAD